MNPTGLLLAIVGAWLIARTVTDDSSGRNLADHVLGTNSKSQGSSDLFSEIGADVNSMAATSGTGGKVAINAKEAISGTRIGSITTGELQALGQKFGWNSSQDTAWAGVIKDESGGNPNATNPSSGAYGIGQFLGATKTEYAKYGSESSNPLQQLNAMAQYIKDRYGTPSAALAHENTNHWY